MAVLNYRLFHEIAISGAELKRLFHEIVIGGEEKNKLS